MAIYHLKAKVYSRSKGHSSVAAAAYRARVDMVDQRTGVRHDYRHHSSECLFSGIYAPKDAPDWTRDREKLWNHVEVFENRRNSQLSREFEIALPHELTLEQNRYLLQDFIRENFTRKGLIADAAIHAPGKEGDLRNIHAHVMVVMRKLDGSEFERNNKEHLSLADKKAQLEGWRESWETLGNKALTRWGFEPTLDRRTLEAQGIDRAPGVHLGKSASEMEARGIQTDRGDRQRAAANENSARAALLHLVNDRDREADEWHEADKKNRKAEAESKTLDELAAEQAAEFIRRDRERAEEGGFKTTLDGIREREAEVQRGSMDGQAKRALDDLAAVDPIGTAQHFGHHRGDRLKSPEEIRAEAERARDFNRQDPEPARDPAKQSNEAEAQPQQPTQGRERALSWMAHGEGFDGLSELHKAAAQRSFEAWQLKRDQQGRHADMDVYQYVEYVQEREAKRQAQQTERPQPSPASSRPAAEKPYDPIDAKRAWAETLRQLADKSEPVLDPLEAKRAWAANLRELAEAAEQKKREPLRSADQRQSVDPLEARRAWAANLRELADKAPQEAAKGPQRSAAASTASKVAEARSAPENRPAVAFLVAALAAGRARLEALTSRLETAFTAIRQRASSRDAIERMPEAPKQRHDEQSHARQDTSSQKANRDFAGDLLAEARRQLAAEAAADREKARHHDRQQRDNERQEAERIRELLRQERRAREPGPE